jgi:hypothetical protein
VTRRGDRVPARERSVPDIPPSDIDFSANPARQWRGRAPLIAPAACLADLNADAAIDFNELADYCNRRPEAC